MRWSLTFFYRERRALSTQRLDRPLLRSRILHLTVAYNESKSVETQGYEATLIFLGRRSKCDFRALGIRFSSIRFLPCVSFWRLRPRFSGRQAIRRRSGVWYPIRPER